MLIYAPLHRNSRPELIPIEVSLHFQIPSIKIIGLVSHDVQEAKERLFAAFEASGFEFPKRKIIIHLPPASVSKKGTHFDLPMALAVLLQALSLSFQKKWTCVASGELSLNGKIKATGKLLRTLLSCVENNIDFLFLSEEEKPLYFETLKILEKHFNETPFILPKVFFISTFYEAKNILYQLQKGTSFNSFALLPKIISDEPSPLLSKKPLFETNERALPSEMFQRILLTSLIGYHHLLILGPKGVGKSSCIHWAEYLYQPLSSQVLIENYLTQELQNQKPDLKNVIHIGPTVRPYALIGSCTKDSVIPGAFSLAHGKLFIADEFLEWHKDSLECLRTPLENKNISLSRLGQFHTFPTQFLFLGTSNICPCGGYPKNISLPQASVFYCECDSTQQKKYLKKASGSLYERFDLVTFMWGNNTSTSTKNLNFTNAFIKKTQTELLIRFGNLPGLFTPLQCEDYLMQNKKSAHLLETLLEKFPKYHNFRNKHKILKTALTLSAMDQNESIQSAHFSEALSYRFIP